MARNRSQRTEAETAAAPTAAGTVTHSEGEIHEQGEWSIKNGLLTAAAVGIGVAFIEEELVGGVLLGAAAMLAPNLLPRIGGMLRPVVKGVVRAGYAIVDSTREVVTETSEQFQDVVAEVRAERAEEAHPVVSAEPASEPTPG